MAGVYEKQLQKVLCEVMPDKKNQIRALLSTQKTTQRCEQGGRFITQIIKTGHRVARGSETGDLPVLKPASLNRAR